MEGQPTRLRGLDATDQTVEIRHLTDRAGYSPEDLERLRSVAELEPGEEYRFGLSGDDDACLDVPLVAIGSDAAEIDRLPTGTCAERNADDPTWTISGRALQPTGTVLAERRGLDTTMDAD